MLPIIPFRDRRERLGGIFGRTAVFSDRIDAAVRGILQQVQVGGDAAVLDCTEQFDGVRLPSLRVPPELLSEAWSNLGGELREILAGAARAIRHFHERQLRASWFEEEGGVLLGRRYVAIDRVGVYVPGGTAAYPSSVLMNVIPARVAGVRQILLASPPGPGGQPHPLVLAAAYEVGVDQVFAVGGAQAVGMFAFGTETVPRVDKITGPGNAYVAAAKKQVYGLVGIDSIAGPSEVVILADGGADPRFVASDLAAQAEHDVRASVVLVATDVRLAEAVCEVLGELVADLPRRGIVEASLAAYGACILADTLDQAVEAVNELAPEHLELLVEDPRDLLPRIRHAGAIFLGPFAPAPVGDYVAGPNHVLPTGGTARYASALGVEDFVRSQSVIGYTREGLARTASHVASFARAEALEAHARAVEVRFREPPSEGA